MIKSFSAATREIDDVQAAVRVLQGVLFDIAVAVQKDCAQGVGHAACAGDMEQTRADPVGCGIELGV